MEKKIIMSLVALVFGLLAANVGTAGEPGECASIKWSMPFTKAWFPRLEYVSCKTGDVTTFGARVGESVYAGQIDDAKVGTDINLGPAGTSSNYTSGETVKATPKLNEFQCWGIAGSSATCKRVN